MSLKIGTRAFSWKAPKPFQYAPLQPGQIRVLLLYPGREHDALKVSLAVVTLSQARKEYEALSYVWGSPEKPHRIYCGFVGIVKHPSQLGLKDLSSGYVDITANLHEALLGLRQPDQVRTLWVDSLSINQEDSDQLGEKSRQISIMFEIYRNASRVIIWLGVQDKLSRLGFACIARLDEIYAKELKDDWRHQREIQLSNPLTRNHWDAFCVLLHRPWFQRLWTYQESVANGRTIVQQGSCETEWEKFERACQLVAELRNRPVRIQINGSLVFNNTLDGLFCAGESEICIDKNMLSTMAIQSISNIAKTRWDVLLAGPVHDERSLKESSSLRLKVLLPSVRALQCADDRDKVLGVLSLARYKADILPELSYSLALKDLCIRVAEYWLNSEVDKDLGFLNHLQAPNEEHKLPTWVPDWSMPPLTASLVSDYKQMDWNKLKSVNFEVRAAGASKVEAELVLHDSAKPLLQVKGIALMTIEIINSDYQLESFCCSLKEHSLLTQRYPLSNYTYLQELELMLNMSGQESRNGQNFWDYRDALQMSQNASKRWLDLPARGALDDSETVERLIRKYGAAADIKRFCSSFFLSNLGFMGQAPVGARPGDVVQSSLELRRPLSFAELKRNINWLANAS